MPTVALTNVPISIADGESITGWSGDTFSLEPDIKVEGSNSVACAQTVSGNNDAIFTKASGSWDFSGGEHLRLWFNSSAAPTYADIMSNGGIQIGLSDGSNTDWFYVGGSDTYDGGWAQIVLYTLTTPDVDNSADLSAITNITFRMATTSKPRNTPANLWLDAWTYGDGYTITGGTSGDELDWTHVAAEDKTNAYGICEEIEGVIFLAGDIQIGDGATTTWWKETQQIVVFKDLPVLSTLYQILMTGSGCRIDIEGGVYATSGGQVFVLDCDNVNIATFSLVGKQIVNASAALFSQSDHIINSCVFSSCGQINPRGTLFQDNIIQGYSGTDAAMVDAPDFDTLINNVFKNNTDPTNDPAAIEHNSGGSWDYDNLTFSGNDYDILNSINPTVETTYSAANQDTDVNLDATNKKVAETFTFLDLQEPWISNAKFLLKSTGSPTGLMYVRLYATSGGVPTGAPLVSSPGVAASVVGGTYALHTFEFKDPFSMTILEDYAIAIEYEDGDGSNYLTVGVDDSSPSYAGSGYLYTTSWAVQTWDVCFTVYTGGLVIINATNGSNPSQGKVRSSGSPLGVTVINNTISHALTGLQQNSEVTYTAKPTASDSGATGSTVAGSRNFTDTGWTTDEHKGRLLEIEEGADAGRYYIVSNTTTVLKLDTELTTTLSNLDYSIYAGFDVVDTEENVGAGGVFTHQYNYSADAYVDILIFHQDYEPIELIDILLGATSQSIPISQVFDVNYFNPT